MCVCECARAFFPIEYKDGGLLYRIKIETRNYAKEHEKMMMGVWKDAPLYRVVRYSSSTSSSIITVHFRILLFPYSVKKKKEHHHRQ